jgi:hypothetical protein
MWSVRAIRVRVVTLHERSGNANGVHPDYGDGPLETLADRDAFRASLPPGTNMAAV